MRKSTLPESIPPRGLNLSQAAPYVGVSRGTFQKMTRLGLAPGPLDLSGLERRIYDRLELDRAMDARAVRHGVVES
jgi:hypothetical protein